ncbi:ferredoxin [Actinomadura luteofluorescens]|uniref:ferredoxin n=1 Tax=Actinomadura luteofluorescens TaxID=46163 RepID=UPI003496C29C
MRIVADHDHCLGAGQCALYAPEVFDQSDEDGTVVLLAESPPGYLHEMVRQAARMCPNQVISLREHEAADNGADTASPADAPSP